MLHVMVLFVVHATHVGRHTTTHERRTMRRRRATELVMHGAVLVSVHGRRVVHHWGAWRSFNVNVLVRVVGVMGTVTSTESTSERSGRAFLMMVVNDCLFVNNFSSLTASTAGRFVDATEDTANDATTERSNNNPSNNSSLGASSLASGVSR